MDVTKIAYHLSALGWGWTLLFLALDALAIACAYFSIVRRQHKVAALSCSGVATLGTWACFAAQALGLGVAFQATADGVGTTPIGNANVTNMAADSARNADGSLKSPQSL